MASTRTDLNTFEWRVGTGRWRWLLLGSLGAASACAGKTDGLPLDPQPGPGGTRLASAKFHVCNEPEPLDGGWERCANGLVHRPVVGECTSRLPRAQGIDPAVIRSSYPGYVPGSGVGSPGVDRPFCERDSDCTEAPHGHCEQGGYAQAALSCVYGCVVDSDCNEGNVCDCGAGPVGSCVHSLCSSDADCEGDALCAKVESAPGCSQQVLACQTSRDTCATDADCGEEQNCSIDLYSSTPSEWSCSGQPCSIGRPFLVDGSARLAPSVTRADWLASSTALDAASDLRQDLDAELRSELAAGWLQQALMEHASVAAFARFSLQLLSLSAPADLLSEAAQAQADEVAHARDCFALARQHGAGNVGPGPLPLGGALDETELSEIVLGTLLEGCIGETVAALEAAEAGSHCMDPAARAVLGRIAEDETRHAQLAWRFVAWALEVGPASLRGQVREAFARELAGGRVGAPRSSERDRRLLQHGLMTAELRSALRARVLREVIAPSVDALLAGSASRNRAVSADASPAC
ncbi:MAG TPA: ferritin-like domain-containing protein [Polyangiaceae bacterium]|nr:ferritin-like domain-containing protein [Polyangiaceae bacterium]